VLFRSLNAGQVWRYLTEYSSQANRLPLDQLHILLQDAIKSYKQAIKSNGRVVSFDSASRKFKMFLDEATLLAKQVWTRFNSIGMFLGSLIVGAMLLASLVELIHFRRLANTTWSWYLEAGLTLLFIVFTCGVLSFGNSYIEKEQSITMFSLSVLSLAVSARIWIAKLPVLYAKLLLCLPILARLHELLISGHGLDPSLSTHKAHHPFVFLSSVVMLGFLRTRLLRNERRFQQVIDLATLAFLSVSWLQKRHSDTSQSGFTSCRVALALWAIGILLCMKGFLMNRREQIMVTIKIGIGLMIVTGPSASASLIVVFIQLWILNQLSAQKQVSLYLFRKYFLFRCTPVSYFLHRFLLL